MTAFPPGAVTEWRYVDLEQSREGVRAVELCRLAGISYRQLDYWTRTGILTSTVPASGSGSQRLYDADEIALAALMRDLLDVGLALRVAHRAALDLLEDGRVAALTDRLYLVRVP